MREDGLRMGKLGHSNLKWQVYDICIYQNPQNFTMQRVNLNACKFLNCLEIGVSQGGMQTAMVV